MDTIRQSKVSRLIQREMSLMFQHECKEIVTGAMLTVTSVRVSSDLSYAKIYLSIFPSKMIEDIMENLKKQGKTVRYTLGKKLGKQLRIIPELRFFLDDSLDYVDNIDDLLKK